MKERYLPEVAILSTIILLLSLTIPTQISPLIPSSINDTVVGKKRKRRRQTPTKPECPSTQGRNTDGNGTEYEGREDVARLSGREGIKFIPIEEKGTIATQTQLLALPDKILLCVADYLDLGALNSFLWTSKSLQLLLVPQLKDSIVLNQKVPVLISAARRGQEGLTRTLLHIGIDPNEQSLDSRSVKLGTTALCEAAAHGHPEVTKLLLENFANPNFQDLDGRTPLHHAIHSPDAFVFEEGYKTQYVKRQAAIKVETIQSIIALLLQEGAEIDTQDFDARTALHYAVISDYHPVEKVKLLLENGASPDIEDDEGNTPLQRSILYNGHDCAIADIIIEDLASKSLRIDSKNRSGQTALYQAIDSGLETAIRSLLENGADPNTEISGETVLHQVYGTTVARCNIYQLLLDAGADIETLDLTGTTILRRAVSENNNTLVKFLLENGANVNQQDKGGQDVPYFALRNSVEFLYGRKTPDPNYEKIAKILLKGRERSQIDAVDNLGNTALHLAAKLGFAKVVKLLLDEGANAEAKDNRGMTAIQGAIQAMKCFAHHNHLERVMLLLVKHGVDITNEDLPGLTPLPRGLWLGRKDCTDRMRAVQESDNLNSPDTPDPEPRAQWHREACCGTLEPEPHLSGVETPDSEGSG